VLSHQDSRVNSGLAIGSLNAVPAKCQEGAPDWYRQACRLLHVVAAVGWRYTPFARQLKHPLYMVDQENNGGTVFHHLRSGTKGVPFLS